MMPIEAGAATPTTGAADPASRRKPSPLTDWLGDFAWEDGKLVVRKTGIRLALSAPLLNEIAHWAGYLAILGIATLRARSQTTTRRAIWYAPDRPRPWYLLRGAALWAGFTMARSQAEACATFYFDDATVGEPPPTLMARRFNHSCTDISKSHVAQVFEDVFGYPLRVDPLKTCGEIVEKPEKNGVHAGRIVMAPLTPKPGFVYQRIVDTRDDRGCCHDLRTPCVGGVPVLVWVKVKTPEGRFSINNKKASLADAEAIFSAAERALIGTFNQRMGLDWGGLDILRDRKDGRIYIVDVNKTDLGPVIALSWRDKIRSMNRLAAAFQNLIGL